ncbi:MAG: ribbon-helix-helix domain-containing protein [Phenylobacterium sp.]|uniref:CopG family ribbon-helix-helix protein n=1 Tax=Phenylobacterium sp. TaxID=1871053 RepID=UPI0027182D77|nr:ribbon-helix-helix domain-containing protein [Phenylobacterium sp.]MDO8409005.1 ribbon-helix-helix domain-containing protein [Phenylobacterium sp.]
MATSTKVVTAHIPLELADKVEAAALRLDRSRGWIMKQALAAWVDQDEARHRMTLEALEDVDAGRVIDQQAILAWADSLTADAPLPAPTK